ncbi:hypothetical protein [Alicyclobacillus sp. SO9]|uniref:hypothetical protein n=1 Tax=Alicyclobacillus sp. SO9 TaxID=2665646 RepID=UPI0018E7D4FB|nr:hypothetical protein [Alicyclobacillus sp. SO9]QQE78088.1 hypothetical protein GI364_19675 [Alicyclobacillus sp. SO9]
MSVDTMAGWVDEFTMANQTLQLMIGLSRQGLDRARLKLSQTGRISYKKGSGYQAGQYRLIPCEC